VTNVVDFESHKKALMLTKDANEAEEPDINAEIEWASTELEIIKDSLEDLKQTEEMHESYKTELVSYLSGMEMAKKLIDGGELQGTDFWSWVEDEDDNKQLEIMFTPDFEINTDE
jgi:hypothetical protein